MASEMGEQPARLAALIARRHQITRAVAPLLDGIVGTVIVARGSSDHAATVGRYMLEMATRRPVGSASPSVLTLYGVDVSFAGHLVVGVSQSGRTPEIARYLEQAAHSGARTVAITNDASSPLANAAEAVVDLQVGEEQAVPATKTVTAEIVGFALLAAAAGAPGAPGAPGAAPADEAWGRLPAQVHEVLADSSPIEDIAAWLRDARRLATVARGLLFGAAQETGLKLQETTSLLATAFSAADLRHGPIALAATGIPVLAMAHPGPASADVLDLCAELDARGADVRLLGPVPGAACGWDPATPELLAPVLAVVRGQQLAHALARRLGVDPDHPAGLSKVTVT
jgi:glutamine---fructose-6-phosphate transaminase (isomerizing)